jgi:AcrR family transcriptional regulator
MPRRPPGSDARSVWLRPAPAPRQPQPAFSRTEITQAAIGLADRHGLQAVSMRRIAERIGSAPTSLYWYFSDKNQLYELMVDAVIGEIELPERPSGDWRADLASLAWATRAALRCHPWFAQLGIHPVPGPQTTRYGEIALRSLQGLGLDDAAQVNILAALNNYIFGFLQRESAWQQLMSHSRATAAQRETRPGGRGARTAGLRSVSAQHLAARTNLSGDDSFAFGLDCLLDGIAARIAQAGQQPRPRPEHATRRHTSGSRHGQRPGASMIPQREPEPGDGRS